MAISGAHNRPLPHQPGPQEDAGGTLWAIAIGFAVIHNTRYDKGLLTGQEHRFTEPLRIGAPAVARL